MVKTRIACYFDVPRADNRSDYHNFVDVRSRPTRLSRPVSRRARVGADAFERAVDREKNPLGSRLESRTLGSALTLPDVDD
jgi:hypothetical protein